LAGGSAGATSSKAGRIGIGSGGVLRSGSASGRAWLSILEADEIVKGAGKAAGETGLVLKE
jgi:hypothetical protein